MSHAKQPPEADPLADRIGPPSKLTFPKNWTVAVALAAVWAFGKGALRELLGALQGGGGGES